MSLDEIYRAHPLRESTILARLERQRRTPSIEWHFALDSETDVTDQNHSGGVQSVLELAVAAGVSPLSHVADVGAGLAGSARVLAQAFQCSVTAYERDPGRCRDARSLTRQVGLEQLVKIVEADVLTTAASPASVDVLWGQAAWIHFADIDGFLDLWLPCLRRGGRVAVADAHLARPPVTHEETDMLASLSRAWAGHLRPIETWRETLRARGASVEVFDRSDEARASFARLIRASSRWPEPLATAAEQESWQLAMNALTSGLVGSFQMVATFP